MKTTKLFVIAAIACLSLSSCVVYQSHDTTGNPVGSKKGVSESKIAKSFDAGIAAAAKDGGITKIATVDYGVKVGLISTTYKIKITGE